MPRGPRKKSSTGIYHVTDRGINKLSIFNSNREKTRFQNLLREYKEKYDVQIYAYCIMSNHFHLLIKADLEELASFMAKILAIYAIYYNKVHQRIGYVFEGRYRSQCIENANYFWNCLRYIHCNPIKANICKSEELYKYSSAREYYGEKEIEIVALDALEYFEEKFVDKQEFHDFHQKGADKSILFIDTLEEEFAQQKAHAEGIFEQMQKDLQINAEEILDDITMRNLFDNVISICLKIKKEQAKRVRNAIAGDYK